MSRPTDPGAGRLYLRRRLIVSGASALAVLALIVVAAALWGLWTFNSAGPAAANGRESVVILRRGAGLMEIAGSLEQAGVIGSASVFGAAAQMSGAARELKAGEYAFASRAPLGAVLDKIRHGRVVRHLVTIPEGITSAMAVEILMASPVLQGSAPVPPEGEILPETYDVQRGEDRAEVLRRMTDAHDRLLADLWAKRRDGLPLASPRDAVNLAAIVEKETAIASERPRIAAVFINRLERGMRLESDPTVIYGLTRGRPLGHGLRQSELAQANPWSTYQIEGLPPTPIANPGRASLAAVLDPPRTQELYFVADGSGGHVFAATYADHVRNVERWRRIEQAANTPPQTLPSRQPRPQRRPMTGEQDRRRGLMLVVSSPSGAGKTSLSRRLISEHPALSLSVSVTTRAPRPGEQDGREYHFVTAQTFDRMVRNEAFLEWAEVHEHRYGSPKAPIMAALADGRDVLFDIDWQGAMRIAAGAPDDVARVFVLPPSMAELSRRLHARAEDAEDVIARRLGRAGGEIRMWSEYDYVLINEDFDATYARLAHIYQAERLQRRRNPGLRAFVDGLLAQTF